MAIVNIGDNNSNDSDPNDGSLMDRITTQYNLTHDDLDTSMRMKDFEDAISEKVSEQLHKDKMKAAATGKAVGKVVEVNNFENNEETKFYRDELGELIKNVNGMTKDQLEVQKNRMNVMLSRLEDSDAKEKDFLLKEYKQSQEFLESEYDKRNSYKQKAGDLYKEARNSFLNFESASMALVGDNPMGAMLVTMYSNYRKRQDKKKKEEATLQERDIHRSEVAKRNEEDKAKLIKQEEERAEELKDAKSKFSKDKKTEDDAKRASEPQRPQNGYDSLIRNEPTTPLFVQDVEGIDEGEESQFSKDNENNIPEPESRAEELNNIQDQTADRKLQQKFNDKSLKTQLKQNKLLKCICKNSGLVEKHTKAISKKDFGGGGGMLGGGMMMRMIRPLIPYILAIVGGGIIGTLIGKSINKVAEKVLGNTVGSSLYDAVNTAAEPDEEQKKKDIELGIDPTDYAAASSAHMNQLEDKGIVDYNRWGESEVEDWGKLEKLNIYELKQLYAFDDLGEDDKLKLEEIIREKQKQIQIRWKVGKAKRAAAQSKFTKDKESKSEGEQEDTKDITKDSTETQIAENDRNNERSLTGEKMGDILGSVSAKYESGRNGVGTISTGQDDYGGSSYGKYQLASKENKYGGSTLKSYLEDSEFKDQLTGDINSDEFKDNWKRIAKENPEGFEADQHDFIKRTHYDKRVEDFQKMGFEGDLDKMPGLANAIWSQSVQHGKGGNKQIFKKVLGDVGPDASEEELVKSMYSARSDYTDGLSKNKRYTPGQKRALKGLRKNRYGPEEQDALALVGTGTEEPDLQVAQNDLQKQSDISEEIQTSLVKDVETSPEIAEGALVSNETPSSQMVAEIDATNQSLQEMDRNESDQPIMIDNSSIVSSSGGGGGGEQVQSLGGARNTESSLQRITDRYISSGMA